MSNDQSWVTSRINEAKKLHPLVTPSVSAQMEAVTLGQFSERQSSKSELTSLAVELLKAMVPTPQQTEETK